MTARAWISGSRRCSSDEVHRAAHPADDVLALGIRQVVAEGAGRAGHRVAREADATAGALAAVAEDHLDDVDRRAEVVGDALVGSVEPGAFTVPGAEDRATASRSWTRASCGSSLPVSSTMIARKSLARRWR